MPPSPRSPNPRRVAAGKLNREKRRGLTPEGRERLRQLALVNRPWQHATGPRSAEGKARAARNVKLRQKESTPTAELRRSLGEVKGLLNEMTKSRRLVELLTQKT